MKSEQINELATALAKAQGKFQLAKRSGENPAFKRDGKATPYSTLGDVWDACRAALSENGLSVIQPMEETEGGLTLTTVLLHTSGQWVDSHARLAPVQNTPQGIGSALTYMRRYQLTALLGIAADDDGNAASAGSTQATTAKPAQATQRQPVQPPKAQPAQRPPAEPEPQPESGDALFAQDGDGWNAAWRAMGDYPAATEWGWQSGKFAARKHLDNAWRKVFVDHQAHEESNAAAFLAAWREYVGQHAGA